MDYGRVGVLVEAVGVELTEVERSVAVALVGFTCYSLTRWRRYVALLLSIVLCLNLFISLCICMLIEKQ